MPIYIYGLKCPIAETIRYVGKSINPKKRLRGHLTAAKTGRADHHTARWIRKLISLGVQPELVILREVMDGERWQIVEREFIANAELSGWKLTNSTAGGEGLDYIDPVAAEKYRTNLSRAMVELWNRPERRAEARARSLKAWEDPEITSRRISALKQTHSTDRMKRKMSDVNTEINSRPEVRAKRSESLRKSWADPAVSARRKASLNSESVRSKMSASAKARWADPEKGSAMRQVRSSEESRGRYRQAALDRATPEYRAAMAERTRKSWEKRRAEN